MSPYLTEIESSLPRLLSLFDSDPTNMSYGQGDRYYWSWKLIDFGNGTFQGAAHGLARLLTAQLLPSWVSPEQVIHLIHSIFTGAEKLIRKDGSLEEAFPYEASYCVTALVAHDLLAAIDILQEKLDENVTASYLEIIAPMIDFLEKEDEHHAMISNHLATAIAALMKWRRLSNATTNKKAKLLAERILAHQSSEGWFSEYGGFDPGYQTLCTHYLVEIYKEDANLIPIEAIGKSIDFLEHFIHPDGSLGGVYGSRNTRFYYPGGIEFFADKIESASRIASYMRKSISKHNVVTLACMDEPNLIPMFNSYCLAAAEQNSQEPLEPVFSEKKESFQHFWKGCGIFMDKTENCYSIVACKKGGAYLHFENSKLVSKDHALVLSDKKGNLYSNQVEQEARVDIQENKIEIHSRFYKAPKKLPGLVQFILLRLLCITVLKQRNIRNLIKNLLVYSLITKKQEIPCTNIRTICFSDEWKCTDKTQLAREYKKKTVAPEFHAIHMASAGYWSKS